MTSHNYHFLSLLIQGYLLALFLPLGRDALSLPVCIVFSDSKTQSIHLFMAVEQLSGSPLCPQDSLPTRLRGTNVSWTFLQIKFGPKFCDVTGAMKVTLLHPL